MVENNKLFIAFLHAKSFATPVLVAVVFFFSFSFLLVFHKGNAKSVVVNILSFITQETCGQDRTYFIGHTKKSLRKACGKQQAMCFNLV